MHLRPPANRPRAPRGPQPRPARRARRRAVRRADAGLAGFSIIELIVVLALVAIMLTVAATSFTDWHDRTAARRAARVFARDVALARSTAARGREVVVIRFYEGSRWYTVGTASGRELARRRYGGGEEVALASIDLDMPGDSLVFGARGMADLSGIGSSLGEARFESGAVTYEVAFNSLGASRVDEL